MFSRRAQPADREKILNVCRERGVSGAVRPVALPVAPARLTEPERPDPAHGTHRGTSRNAATISRQAVPQHPAATRLVGAPEQFGPAPTAGCQARPWRLS